MKRFIWNSEKNEQLKASRGITFGDVMTCIQNAQVLAVIRHPNQQRYPDQQIFIIRFNDYAWIIPFIESDKEIFLKTAIPSRKMTKRYLEK